MITICIYGKLYYVQNINILTFDTFGMWHSNIDVTPPPATFGLKLGLD